MKQPMKPKALNDLCNVIDNVIPDDCSFFFFIAPTGNPRDLPEGSGAQYAASMTRSSALNCMKEFLLKNDQYEAWMDNIDWEAD